MSHAVKVRLWKSELVSVCGEAHSNAFIVKSAHNPQNLRVVGYMANR